MIILFLFILLITGVGVLILYTNKSEPAKEIKSLIKKIYENLLDLFKNLKALFILIGSLISQDDNSNKDIAITQEQNKNENLTEPSEPSSDLEASNESSYNKEKAEDNFN